MINNNLFLRYEFKYFMNSKISDEIFNQSLNFMNIDNYALKNHNNKYLVRSLYFDNDDYSNFLSLFCVVFFACFVVFQIAYPDL